MTVLKISKFALAAFMLGMGLSGFAYGQQSAAISQTGDENKTVIDQQGQENTASVNIIGDYNGQLDGTVTQAGSGAYTEIRIEGDANAFDVRQTGGADAGTFYGEVDGDLNSFDVDQINTQSDAYQNYGVILQSGNGNTATLGQSVEAYGLTGGLNQSYITQYGDDNTATITQNGTDNYAALTQDGNGNNGTITQDGNGLYAELNQVGDNLPGYAITQTCAGSVCDQGIIVNQTADGFVPTVTTGAGS